MLMTHAVKGVQAVDRAQLRRIPVPVRPECSDRWMPVQHGALVDGIHAEASSRGLVATDERWAVDSQGMRLWGSIDFKLPKVGTREYRALDLVVPDGMGLSLALRHSNGGHYAVTVGAGGKVFVCDNGVLTAEYICKRKHTTGFDLDALVQDAFAHYVDESRNLNAFVERFQEADLSQTEANDLLLQAGRDNVVSWSLLGKVDAEWREPRHPEFSDRNAWSLYNAFTQVAQNASVSRQLRMLNGARDLIQSHLN